MVNARGKIVPKTKNGRNAAKMSRRETRLLLKRDTLAEEADGPLNLTSRGSLSAPNGFEGKHHAEFDAVPPQLLQSERARISCRLSRRRGQSLPRLRPDPLANRPPVSRVRLLRDGVAAQGSDDPG